MQRKFNFSHTLNKGLVENNVPQREKYRIIAERLLAKVATYAQEPDKLQYLRAIAHIVSG